MSSGFAAQLLSELASVDATLFCICPYGSDDTSRWVGDIVDLNYRYCSNFVCLVRISNDDMRSKTYLNKLAHAHRLIIVKVTYTPLLELQRLARYTLHHRIRSLLVCSATHFLL